MTHVLVAGWYRYSDIWWEWAQVVDQEEAYPLKSILAYEALVDPEHPLRVPGKDGIELSIGTFPSGEARLLFSSAQVEYIRYWLHEMGLTKKLISLPYSDCLLRKSSFATLAPVVYKDAAKLKGAIKEIDKLNKKLKKGGADSSLVARRLTFERVRTLWSHKKGVWCAIDFEAWDRDHTALTEFGWSMSWWENGEIVEQTGHLIVEENRNLRNTFVAQHRWDYDYGTSERVNKVAFKQRVNEILNELFRHESVFLIFHDPSQDLKYLRGKSVEAPLEGLSHILPETCTPGLFVVDTAGLYGALEGEGHNTRSLQQMCNQLKIPSRNLHNAGNDARYTHLALKSMASGDPLDTQRETRWPKYVINGVKVQMPDGDSEDEMDDEMACYPYNPKTGILNKDWLGRQQPNAVSTACKDKENAAPKTDGAGVIEVKAEI
ncbi:hypothetical protein OF83DRAFT_1163334 [Amylostereum chailletii]|nr:hypothetical protein OF83DRAFT_1163334 [Amylostereum chailletii]